MELRKIETFTGKTEDGGCYEETMFAAGKFYRVTERILWKSGDDAARRDIIITAYYKDGKEHYLPRIRYDAGFWGNEDPKFEIQTSAYGAKSPAEIKKIIAGYEEAVAVVAVLEKHFL